MKNLRVLLVVVVWGSACARRPLDLPEPDGGINRDLAVHDLNIPRDLTVPPDLTVVHDLANASTAPDLLLSGGFCAGTKVANTCAQAFFQKVATCMGPEIGCVQQTTPLDGTSFIEDTCWLSGAQRHISADGKGNQSVTWTNSHGGTCMTSHDQFLVDVLHANGATLSYDEASGSVTCPDGSTVAIGTIANGDLCGAVESLLTDNCALGSCGNANTNP